VFRDIRSYRTGCVNPCTARVSGLEHSSVLRVREWDVVHSSILKTRKDHRANPRNQEVLLIVWGNGTTGYRVSTKVQQRVGRIHSFEHREMSLAERLMSTFTSPCRKHHEVYGYVSLELDPDTRDMYPDLMGNHRPFRPQESHSGITKRHRKHNSYRPNKSRHPTPEPCSIVESSIVRPPVETEHVGCVPE